MRYAVLLYDDETKFQDMTPEAGEELMAKHFRFGERVTELGGSVADGQPLQGTATAKTSRSGADGIAVTDGPFAETTEQLGGYYVIDMPDLDVAIEAVKVLPHHSELRPVVVHEAPPADDAPAMGATSDLFVVLLYGDEEPWLQATPEEREAMYAQHGAFAAGVVARGAAVAGGEELAHSSTATTVRRAGGDDVVVSDGPFAETAEQLTGFYVIRASGMDVVLDAITQLPGESNEVRPVQVYGDIPA